MTEAIKDIPQMKMLFLIATVGDRIATSCLACCFSTHISLKHFLLVQLCLIVVPSLKSEILLREFLNLEWSPNMNC